MKIVTNKILSESEIKPRQLPVSDILKKRKDQVYEFIKTWDPKLEDEIIAMNFYPDIPKEIRMEQATALLDEIGEIVSVGELEPLNQLRGRFMIKGENNDLSVFFTLTPEAEPKVQRLDIAIRAKQN